MSSSESSDPLPSSQDSEGQPYHTVNWFLVWLAQFCLWLSLLLPLIPILNWLFLGRPSRNPELSPPVFAFGQSTAWTLLAYCGHKGILGVKKSRTVHKEKGADNSSLPVRPLTPAARRKLLVFLWCGISGFICVLGLLAHLRTGHPSLAEVALWQLLSPTGIFVGGWLLTHSVRKTGTQPVATIPSAVPPQVAALTGNADALPTVITPVPAVEEQPAVVAVRRSG